MPCPILESVCCLFNPEYYSQLEIIMTYSCTRANQIAGLPLKIPVHAQPLCRHDM